MKSDSLHGSLPYAINVLKRSKAKRSVLLCLDHEFTKKRGPAGISRLAELNSLDRTMVRRAIKGSGVNYPYERSLLGLGLVTKVIEDEGAGYVITEKGRHAICGLKRKPMIKQVSDSD